MVGTLAITNERSVAFEYDKEWLKDGFSISPFSLPLKEQVFIPSKHYFNGLFGVFADSLPDAWGNILLNRVLKKNGKNIDRINVLDRLSIVGSSGMGALTYEPANMISSDIMIDDLDELANQCSKILNSENIDNLDELYELGGTSGGARPKILTSIDDEEWIIKFPAHVDKKESGKMEYDYALCAKKCGINMTDVKLFPSNNCLGYFGTKRFDRENEGGKIEKKHMITVAGLLELDFEQPSLDYHTLMKVTKIITQDDTNQLEEMFKRMCFNVYAHNRDDHSKNFSYIYDDRNKKWNLSPAYDMTYSTTYYGEHTTTVNGNGVNPSKDDLIEVGVNAGIERKKCMNYIEFIRENVLDSLKEYL